MDTNNMIRRYSLLLGFFLISGIGIINAQNITRVQIMDGLADNSLKQTIEKNASNALSELNRAFVANQKPKVPSEMTKNGKEIILTMWELSPFRCPETLIQENILKNVHGGYEIRNIPVIVKEANPGNQYQEMAMIFNSHGKVEEIYYTLEMNQYLQLRAAEDTVADYRRRQIIIDFLEKFRTAYNRKDINMISKVYSDDALIIVGRVVKQQKSSDSNGLQGLPANRVEYIRLSKEKYINNLKRCFSANQYININFSSIELVRHGEYPEIYGVTLKQEWNSTNYSDVGYLFLMIDFKDEDNPLIKVRTWEPEKDNAGGIVTDESNRIHLGNFDVIR